jgi:hypothetical protein
MLNEWKRKERVPAKNCVALIGTTRKSSRIETNIEVEQILIAL